MHGKEQRLKMYIQFLQTDFATIILPCLNNRQLGGRLTIVLQYKQ